MQNRGPKYNKAQVEEAAALYAASWRVYAISERIGVCPATVYRWIRERPPVWRSALAQHTVGPRPPKLATLPAQPTKKRQLREARAAWAVKQYRRGHSAREVAEGLALAICSVRRYLSDAGLGRGYYTNRWGLGWTPELMPDEQWMRGTYQHAADMTESRDAFHERMRLTRESGHRYRRRRKERRWKAVQADIDAGITDVRVLAPKHGVSDGCIRADGYALGYHTRCYHLRKRDV